MIACRYYETFEKILYGIEKGYYLKSAAEDIKNYNETRRFKEGNDTVQANRGVQDSTTDKTDYQKEYELYELFGRMPKKWIYTVIGQEYEDGEELVPARVIFHNGAVVGVEINDDYEGEAPIYKMDYLPRNGSFYGIGVPAMVKNPQAVVNEIVNQRIDNGAQALNHTFAVIQKALVNPKEDLVSKPGQIIRLDSKYVPNGEAKNAISQLVVNDTPVRAGFAEVQDAERWAQERSSANTVMMGSSSAGRDGTNTLGEKQMMKESAGDKLAYIGLRMEVDFLNDFFMGIWKTIYNHITPEDVEESIGEKRAAGFILVHPEEISRDYVYRPNGVYTMANKVVRQAQEMQIREAFKGAPWANDEKFFDSALNNIGEDPDKFKYSENEIMQQQAQMIQPGMDGMPPGGPGMPPQGRPPVDTVGAPMPPEMPPPMPPEMPQQMMER